MLSADNTSYKALAPRPENKSTDSPTAGAYLEQNVVDSANGSNGGGSIRYMILVPDPLPQEDAEELTCWHISSAVPNDELARRTFLDSDVSRLLNNPKLQKTLIDTLSQLPERLKTARRKCQQVKARHASVSRWLSETMRIAMPEDFQVSTPNATRTWVSKGSNFHYVRSVREAYMHPQYDVRWCFNIRLTDGCLQRTSPEMWASFTPSDYYEQRPVREMDGFTTAEVELYDKIYDGHPRLSDYEDKWQAVGDVVGNSDDVSVYSSVAERAGTGEIICTPYSARTLNADAFCGDKEIVTSTPVSRTSLSRNDQTRQGLPSIRGLFPDLFPTDTGYSDI